MALKIVLAAALLAACVASAHGAAFPTTTGLRYLGYTMVSNVTGYTNMTQDVCDIQKALLANNATRALDIYLNGKNSVRGTALRKFQTWATSVHTGETYYEQLASYYGPNFTTTLNDTITKAFTSGQGSLGLSLIVVTVQSTYLMHEIDEAFEGVKEGNTNATSGPAHNLDETWAILTGAHPDNCTTLIGLADEFGKNMATTHSGQAETFLAINVLMNELQYFTLTGNATVNSTVKYSATAASLRKELAIVQAQIVLGGAYVSELYAKCKVTGPSTTFKNMAFAAWWPLAAQLSAWKAPAASLKAVNTAVTASSISYAAVKRALLTSTVLRDIDIADIGLPVAARLTPPGCTATVTP